MNAIETRETPGGGMEVLDADGIWRTVPHALIEFIKHHKPAVGFDAWEWHIGQVYTAGIFPPNGIVSGATPEENEAADKVVRAFMDGFEARFPKQVNKFAEYMGWKRRVPVTSAE